MNSELFKHTEKRLAEALNGTIVVNEFKALSQFYVALLKNTPSGDKEPFSPEECRKGLDRMFGKEAE